MTGILYIVSGFAGYMQFGEATDGNILNNYRGTNVFSIQYIQNLSGNGGILIPVYIAFSFIVMTSYPLINFSTRIAISKSHIKFCHLFSK